MFGLCISLYYLLCICWRESACLVGASLSYKQSFRTNLISILNPPSYYWPLRRRQLGCSPEGVADAPVREERLRSSPSWYLRAMGQSVYHTWWCPAAARFAIAIPVFWDKRPPPFSAVPRAYSVVPGAARRARLAAFSPAINHHRRWVLEQRGWRRDSQQTGRRESRASPLQQRLAMTW